MEALETERKEKIDSRRQTPFAAIIAISGLLAYMLQGITLEQSTGTLLFKILILLSQQQ